MSMCIVKIIDEFGEIEKNIGYINISFIKKINTLADQSNLPLLASIDANDCNIYNILQIKEINNELTLIKNNLVSDHKDLTLLNTALHDTIKEESYTYLKISCLSKDQEVIAPFQQFL